MKRLLIARVAGVAGVALLALVAGCGTTPAPVDHPLDAYQLDQAETRIVREARYLLTRQCVRRFRLDLPPMGSLTEEPRRDDYGLADVRDARRWGYTLDWDRPSDVPWEARIEPDSRLFPVVNGRHSDGRPVRIPGLPPDGCRGAARRTLALTDDPVPGIRRQAWSASRESPEVAAATRRWHGCMKRSGYRYEDPVESPFGYWSRQRMRANPRPTAAQRKHGIPPSPAEISAAVADVTCKHESGFLSAWVSAEVEQQRRLVAEHRDELRAHRERLELTLTRGRAVLAAYD